MFTKASSLVTWIVQFLERSGFCMIHNISRSVRLSNESDNFLMILKLFEAIQLIPPPGQEWFGDQVEPGCHTRSVGLSLLYERLQLVFGDVLDGLDLVPVGAEFEVGPEEEDVVDLVFAPFAGRVCGVDDPRQVRHRIDIALFRGNLKNKTRLNFDFRFCTVLIF